MFCTQCGTQIPDGSKFCTGCGAKMEVAPVAPVVTPEPVKEVETVVAPVVEETPIAVEESVETPEETPVVEETPTVEEAPVESAEPEPTAEKKNFCTNCGKELPEGTKFCTGCGAKVTVSAPVEPAQTPEPVVEETAAPVVEETPAPAVEEASTVEETVETAAPEETSAPAVEPQVSLAVPPEKPAKKGKGGVVAIIIILILALAAGGAALWFFVLRDKPIELFETALSEGRYDDAEDIFDELEDEDEEKAEELMVERLSALFDEYSEGKFENYEEFEKAVNAIYAMAEDSDDIKEDLADAALKMQVFYESNKNYQYATEAYEDKEYDDAIRYYHLVDEKDPNYEDAQKGIDTAADSAIADADKMATDGDYYSAKSLLEDAMYAFDSSEHQKYQDMKAKVEEYEKSSEEAEKQQLYNDIQNAIDNKEYDSALKTIKDAINDGDTSTKIEELHREAASGYVNERVELVAPEAETTGNYRDVLEALVIAKDDGDDEYVTEAAADKVSEYMQKFIDDINELLAAKDLKNAIIYLEYLNNFVDNESVDTAIDTYKNLCTIYDWTELSHLTAGEEFKVSDQTKFESGSTFESVYELVLEGNTVNNYAGLVFTGLGGNVQSLHMTIGTFPTIEELVPGTFTLDILANNVTLQHLEGVSLGSTDLNIDLPLGVDCDQVIVKFTLDTPADGGFTTVKPCIGKFVFSSVDLTTTQIPPFSLEGSQGGTESTPEIMPEDTPEGGDVIVDEPTTEVSPETDVENPDASVENPDASVENPDASTDSPDSSGNGIFDILGFGA